MDQQKSNSTPPTTTRRALRLKQVLTKVGLKKTQLFDAVKAGDFPKPFYILPNGRAIAWDEGEIDEHLTRQMKKRAAMSPPRTQIKRAALEPAE